MYTSQTLRVKWKNIVSNDFNVCNSVKQGRVLSPVLFAVYIDGLLRQPKDSGVGFYMDNHFVAAIAYADDIILICPTKKSLDILTGICAEYAYEFSITFNAKKSIFLVYKGREYGEAVASISMCVNGDKIREE